MMMMMKKQFLIDFIYLIIMSMKKIQKLQILNVINIYYIEFFVTYDCCQNDFKTFNTREIGSLTCWSIERKLKKLTFEELKKLANVCEKRKKKQNKIGELAKKVDATIIFFK